MSARPDRNPVRASYWQFDPDSDDDDAEVEALDAAISFHHHDDYVLLSIRGKPRKRYERIDSAWIELTEAEAVRLIERLAHALST